MSGMSSVAGMVVAAQAFVPLAQCAAVLTCSRALRDCTAPRFMRISAALGGVYSFQNTWLTMSPKRICSMYRLLTSAPTIVLTPYLHLPRMAGDDAFEIFARAIVESPMSFVREISLEKCCQLTSRSVQWLGKITNLDILNISFITLHFGKPTGLFAYVSETTPYNHKEAVQALLEELFAGKIWLKHLTAQSCSLPNYVALRHLVRLEFVDLSGNPCCDLRPLAACTQLKTLVFHGWRTALPRDWDPEQRDSDPALYRPFDGLNCTSVDLSRIDPDSNWWSGQPIDPMPHLLCGFKELRALNLSHMSCSIATFQWALPASSRETLLSLTADYCTVESIGVLGECVHLRELRMRHCGSLTSRSFRAPEPSSTASGLCGLEGARALEVVDFSFCCKLEDVNVLAQLPNLAELYLAECVNLTDAGIRALSACVNIVKLDLRYRQRQETRFPACTLTSVAHLSANLDNLRWFDCSFQQLLETPAAIGIDSLTKRKRLRYLNIEGTGVCAGDLCDAPLRFDPERVNVVVDKQPRPRDGGAASAGGGAEEVDVFSLLG